VKTDKFIFCTDSHLANNPPVNRVGDYNAELLAKWKCVVAKCNSLKVDGLICGGDLCHTYRTSDELYVRFVRIMNKLECPFYYLYGNHDIQAGNSNFINNTNMGMLAQFDWFNALDVKEPYEFRNTLLTGNNYTKAQETVEFHGWDDSKVRDTPAIGSKKLTILVSHAMITNGTIMIKGSRKSIDVADVETDADVLLNGHYHIGHRTVVEREMLGRPYYIANPGSMARMNLAEAKETYGPRMLFIKVAPNKKVTFKFYNIPHKPYNEVFDVQAHHVKKAEADAKTQFADMLSNVRSSCVGLDLTTEDGFQEAARLASEHTGVKLGKHKMSLLEELRDGE